MESSDGGDQSASTPSREESASTVGRVKSGLVGGLSWLRSILFASKLHGLVTIVLGLILLVVLGFLLGFLGAPSIQGVENRFGGVNDTTTTIESDLRVNNPNPIGFQFGDTTIDYAIDMNGIQMASGSKEGLSIERGNATIPLTTYMDNERIPDWWESHVRNGEQTTVTVNADAHTGVGISLGAPTVEREIETDITSGLNSTETRPVNADAPLVSDPVLYINETSGSWGDVSDTETDIDMTFTVYNPKSYPIPISELGYDVTMNGVAVGEGASERSVTIPPGETRTITATTVIRNDRLDEWWVTHLERNQVTNLTIDLYARIDLSGLGGGSVRVPLSRTSQTIETDIFGTKDETAPGTGDGSDDAGETGTDSDGTEPTGTAAGETDTPTDDPIGDPLGTPSPTPEGATPVPTPTPDDTPTPTDDGLI